jgi:hypothetical protein
MFTSFIQGRRKNLGPLARIWFMCPNPQIGVHWAHPQYCGLAKENLYIQLWESIYGAVGIYKKFLKQGNEDVLPFCHERFTSVGLEKNLD